MSAEKGDPENEQLLTPENRWFQEEISIEHDPFSEEMLIFGGLNDHLWGQPMGRHSFTVTESPCVYRGVCNWDDRSQVDGRFSMDKGYGDIL